ncbi:hypothetical protein AB0K88_31195 [Streptomyces werraensis]|uniref:hypothetical protein n=1 Tax=Streptomyces werraensis TaxID=68284 RepID=UPI0034303F42
MTHQPETARELASLAANAGRALQDEKRHYEIACQENAQLRAALARIRQMTDYWEQNLPEVIRTPAVVSALRAAMERAAPAAVSAAVAPPTNQTALRDRIAQAIEDAPFRPDERRSLQLADAVLAVLPPTTDKADEVDADTVANRAAQVIATMGAEIRELTHSRDRYRTAWLSARQRVLRRMADETATETPTAGPVCICGHPEERHFEDVCQTCGCGDYLEPQDAAEVIARWRQAALKARAELDTLRDGSGKRVIAYRSRGTRALYCVTCARQETDCDPVANADEQATCAFCGGRVHAVASRTLGAAVAHYLTDGPAAGARQDETSQPSLRDQHRAAWRALTPDQQAARLAELDATDEPAATVPCSGTLGTPHQPHDWEPQPGMDPVHCPGTRKPPMDPVHILGIDADDEPAAGARQDETCTNCDGSGLDPRYNGEFACPDCPAAGARQDGAES